MSRIMVLNIDFSIQSMTSEIHPVVLQDDRNVVLVDCGYVGSLPLLEKEMHKNGAAPEGLTHLLLTHHDHDHMGAAAALLKKYPSIQVVASAKETPFIDGTAKSPRLIQAENLQKCLSEDQKAFGEKFCAMLRSIQPVHVDIQVNDGDTFDWCENCVVLGTSGHTEGHISLWIKNEKTVIAGDAATIENGELVIANPQFTLEAKSAHKSLQTIKNFSEETIICYHGGVYQQNQH